MDETMGDQILQLTEVLSFLQFCPNFRLVYQNRSLYHFFSDPGPKNDQRPQGNLPAYFETLVEF